MGVLLHVTSNELDVGLLTDTYSVPEKESRF